MTALVTPKNELDLTGTSKPDFQIDANNDGPALQNDSGNLKLVDAAGDSVHTTALDVALEGTSDQIVLDSLGTFPTTISSGTTTEAVQVTLPPDNGAPGDILYTDGSGVTTWAAPPGGATNIVQTVRKAIAFGDSSPITLFNLPADAVVQEVSVLVNTGYDGTAPQITVGIAGNTSKFTAAIDANLKVIGSYAVTACRRVATSGSPQALIATYVADSSAAGAGFIDITYVVPTIL